MASVAAWILLAILAPLVLVAPGYLVLRILRAREASLGLGTGPFETFAFSAALSLAIVVLLAFGLSQTLGLTRTWLALAYLLLLASLGLLVRRQEATSGQAEEPQRLEAKRSSAPPEPTAGTGVSSRHLPAILIGVMLAIVATGALIYDGTEPHSQAYYANASEIEPRTTVEPGETVAWTIVVENHEQREANYTVETVRTPQESADEDEPPRVPVEEASLELEDGEEGTHTVRFVAPEGGLWKVQTTVHVDGKETPLTMHRWIAVSGE